MIKYFYKLLIISIFRYRKRDMVPIEKEPKDLYESTRVYEKCIFCNESTDTWNKETNCPVCEPCSKVHELDEIIVHKYVFDD